ncbi:MAG: hypothetical protein R2716_08695 [Microthrixaceae bacterium]
MTNQLRSRGTAAKPSSASTASNPAASPVRPHWLRVNARPASQLAATLGDEA